MKKVTLILAAILVFGVTNIVKAQQDGSDDSHTVSFTVPNFAILDIEGPGGDTDIDLLLSEVGMKAGEEFDFTDVSDNSLWLNYTALTDKQGNNWNYRSISVKVDALVPGLDLQVAVGAATGGAGDLGDVVNTDPVTIGTANNQTIIENVGSCYTGDGTDKGHNLTYSLDANDFSLIEAGAQTVTVTYTITD